MTGSAASRVVMKPRSVSTMILRITFLLVNGLSLTTKHGTGRTYLWFIVLQLPLARPENFCHADGAPMKARKTWREKLADSKGLPKVGKVEGKMTTRWGTGTMVIPAPLEVDELM